MRRFGEAATFAAGERIVRAGEIAPGLIVIVSGQVEVSQDGGGERHETIVVHGPGSFAASWRSSPNGPRSYRRGH